MKNNPQHKGDNSQAERSFISHAEARRALKAMMFLNAAAICEAKPSGELGANTQPNSPNL